MKSTNNTNNASVVFKAAIAAIERVNNVIGDAIADHNVSSRDDFTQFKHLMKKIDEFSDLRKQFNSEPDVLLDEP